MIDIENRMMALRDDSQVAGLSRFFKTGKGQYGEGDRFLGIKVPVTRQLVKEIWKECTLDDVAAAVSSQWHEVRLCALLVLVQLYKHSKKDAERQSRYVDFYLANTRYINNWDLVDLSCGEIMGDWLMKRERGVLYELARGGKTIWEQRIGIVTTISFARKGDFEDALAIADILLHHGHDLIHKATGWTLREVDKHDHQRLLAYLSTAAPGESAPRYTVMPRTMLRYAIEKFSDDERAHFMGR